MKTPKPYVKIFLTTAAAGASFGLVLAIVICQFIEPPVAWFLYLPATVLAGGIISGLAAILATVLDKIMHERGITRESVRTIISFMIVSLLTFTLFYQILIRLHILPDYPDIKRYSLMAVIAGLTFGAAYAAYHYHQDKVRHRLMILELENRHLAELASREELLKEAARNLLVAEERNRMARELHDSISQGIHGITYSLRTLKAELKDNARGLEIHGHLEETAADTLKELRRLIAELNPSPLDDRNLDEAIRLCCDLFARRQQIALTLNLDYTGTLLPDQEVAFYRIMQEALTNIQKHADARAVEVTLKSAPAETFLTICDNGRGFDPGKQTGGNGLANMTARARQSGGRLAIISQPGQGTTITAGYLQQSTTQALSDTL